MSIFDKAAQREKENLPFAVVTVIGSEGRVSRRSGRMVVLPDGEIAGTVGGGAIEDRAIAEAKEAIAEGKGRRITLSNQGRGSIELFIDVPVRSRSLIVVGRGHVGAAVSSLFRTLGWNVTEYDRGTPFSTIDTTRIGNDTAVLIAGVAHVGTTLVEHDSPHRIVQDGSEHPVMPHHRTTGRIRLAGHDTRRVGRLIRVQAQVLSVQPALHTRTATADIQQAYRHIQHPLKQRGEEIAHRAASGHRLR